MASFDTRLPDELAALHRLELPCVDGEVIDFEPFDAFWPPEENRAWIRAWTGNPETLPGTQAGLFRNRAVE